MISLVVVNYRSAPLAVQAIRSARLASSAPLHVVVVDNSCDPSESSQLGDVADELIVSATNRGYAGAINDARSHCRGEVAIVANPDVRFFAGAIDHLAAALSDPRCAVAGPALFWDEQREWILPPADPRTLMERVSEVAASRSPLWQTVRDRRRFRARLAFWSLAEPTPVAAISGAVMAIGLADFDAAGGFDERFRLYFEESDFLRRVRRRGRNVVYVPAAHCRHLSNQSAGEDREQSAALYAASEQAYWSKWYGSRLPSILAALQRAAPPQPFPPCAGGLSLPRPGLVAEASPLPTFTTAAGHRAKGTVAAPPDDVWDRYRDAALYLRAVDPETARTVATCVRYRS